MRSLSPEQRSELSALMQTALEDMDLAREMQQLGDALRSRRPDLDWRSRERMRGDEPLGAGEATSALQDLADLDELESTLGQDYPGASLEDIDEEAVRRALGRNAADEVRELRRLERELEEQGYLTRQGARLDLTPKAIRRLGQTALRRVFADLHATQRGGHDVHDAGQAGELTGSSRPWQFGDEQPLDVVRTLTNAVRRGRPPGSRGLRLAPEDFEVAETERRTSATVCLLLDLSYSMVLRDRWGPAKATALALHALVSGMYPQDAMQVIGFSSYARVLSPTDLAGLEPDYVQGTNLQHALMLAGPLPRQAPRRRADRARRDRRRADRAPDAQRHTVVRLAAGAGDDRADRRRGRPDDPARRRGQRLPARRRPAADRVRARAGPAQRGPGVLLRRERAGEVRRQRLPRPACLQAPGRSAGWAAQAALISPTCFLPEARWTSSAA